MRRRLLIVGIVIALAAGGVGYWLTRGHTAPEALTVYGNVDLRQVSLAFQDSGRITAVLVEEGDSVTKGEAVARLDTTRLRLQVDEAEAQADAQRAAVQKLENGSRPEDIEQARANLEAAEADALDATRRYERKLELSKTAAVSQQDFDAAKAARDVADAKVAAAKAALNLSLAGSRPEDIAQAKATLRADEAQFKLLQQQLADATLKAPVAGTVRSRLLEPGDMASAQMPVVSIAVTNRKWVRAYLPEPDLAKVHPGMAASITIDGLPDNTFSGSIGFISSVAEFTPKSIETSDLRTSLVYEIRVIVNDPKNRLRLGAPATVTITGAVSRGVGANASGGGTETVPND